MEENKQQTLQALLEYYRQKAALIKDRENDLFAKLRSKTEREKLEKLRKEMTG